MREGIDRAVSEVYSMYANDRTVARISRAQFIRIITEVDDLARHSCWILLKRVFMIAIFEFVALLALIAYAL